MSVQIKVHAPVLEDGKWVIRVTGFPGGEVMVRDFDDRDAAEAHCRDVNAMMVELAGPPLPPEGLQ